MLEEFQSSLAGSAIRKSKKASLKAIDSWAKSGTLAPEDFATLNDFAAASGDRYEAMKSKWWKLFKAEETGRPMLDVEKGLAREGGLLAHHNRLVTELREATARSAVQALAGGMLGVAGVVAAYSAYSNGPTWTATSDRKAGELMESLNNLHAGTSPMITEGNKVEQVHREELWKTISNTLDRAVENGKAGKPAELDLQYYELTSPEIVGKIAEAAKAGNPVRVNLDAGRLSFPSKDDEGDSYFSLDATPDKIRTILQLAAIPGADIAVSLFPQKKLINSPTDLMHRKILRYGEDVLISGMNANIGSGENIDSGYVVRGPAAKQLTENFARDVQDSKGATLEDIWGEAHIQKFQDTNLRLGKRGFVSLFDSLGGPSPAGTVLPSPQSLEELEGLAAKAGAKLKDLVNLPAADYEKVMTRVAERRTEVELSAKGKALMRQLIEKAIAATNTPENLERLDRISLPSDSPVGKTRVDIADQPIERETIAMEAISKAESFIYLPGFVVTKAIAAAIVARRDQLQAAGQELDVRVVADSGLYPHGSTPNAYGIKYLEDHGIQPRWSRLERTDWHDRKIHAKQLITDKGEITGSTNFSNQGFQENWETSAYVHFDDNDSKALKERDQTRAQFEDLWDTSYQLDSRDHAAFLNRARAVPASEWTIEEDRDRSIRHILRLMINFEKQSAEHFQTLLAETPEIAKQRKALIQEGYSEGDATLLAAKAHLGRDEYWRRLNELPAAVQLSSLQSEVAEWKSEQKAEVAKEEARTSKAVPVKSVSFRKADFYLGGLRRNEVAYNTFVALA